MYTLTYHIGGAADTYRIPVPIPGRVTHANCVVDLQDVATAEKVITLTNGTSTIGTITVAVDAVEGDIDNLVVNATTLGKVLVGPTAPIVAAMAGAGNGKMTITFVVDDLFGAS